MIPVGRDEILARFAGIPGSVINSLQTESCDYMQKVSSRQSGIPLLHCPDPGINWQLTRFEVIY